MSSRSEARQPVVTMLDTVVLRLEAMIVEDLDPGMQMPSEGDLAVMCNVSRLTIREALKVLAGRGLVEMSRGRRPTVREPDSSVLSGYLAVAIRRDPRALLELNDVRQSLEVLTATLASQRASRASLAAIEAALEGMEAAADRGMEDPADRGPDAAEQYHEADVAFHEAVALAGGNRMLAFLLQGLEESLRRSFHQSFKGRMARGASVQAAIDAHREIFDRIRDGDSAGAAHAMQSHLKEAERDLRAVLRGDNPNA